MMSGVSHLTHDSHNIHDQVVVWVPSTIANLNVGFDALGLALTHPQERMIIRKVSTQLRSPLESTSQISIQLEPDSHLPHDPHLNVAGVAAHSVLKKAHSPISVELSIFKPVSPGSGLGSSAASAVAAAFGVSALLDRPLSLNEILECALDGEEIASGSRHLDNVAPALYGGLCLSSPQGTTISLPLPRWWIVALRPLVTVRTADARAALPTHIPLSQASTSSAWMGVFVHACYQGDHQSAALALQDLYVGPARSHLIPAFDACRIAALSAGALNGGISGSGPTSFWICLDYESAQKVELALAQVMEKYQLPWESYLTQPCARGVYIE